MDDGFSIESPEELADRAVFEQLIRRRYGENVQVGSVLMSPQQGHAILSRVVQVNITYLASVPSIPTLWIAKFQKPSMPLDDDMFRVEGTFYRKYAKEMSRSVQVPTAVYCGKRCIVLEKIQNVISYSLLESCPSDRLESTIGAMAHIHAQFWNKGHGDLKNLSHAAGIGSVMSGVEKEETFPLCWKDFIQQQSDNNALTTLCQNLARRRLRDVHTRVHEYQPTLIHGDFHVGNILYTLENSCDKQLWLIDWATCGAGNPMIDVVFFFLVSTRLSMKDMIHTWLPYYYDILRADNVDDFSWDACLFAFRTCLLNQFLVLVCYDQVSKTLLSREAETKEAREHFTQHFENVNRRCVEALFSDDMNLSSYPLPPVKTKGELLEEAD